MGRKGGVSEFFNKNPNLKYKKKIIKILGVAGKCKLKIILNKIKYIFFFFFLFFGEGGGATRGSVFFCSGKNQSSMTSINMHIFRSWEQ